LCREIRSRPWLSFKVNPNRSEKVVVWDGDAAAPPKLDGTTLTVPVERHNYRLLVVERD
jgi:hypothetical protein